MAETFADILAIGGKTNSLGRTDEVIEVVLSNDNRLSDLYNCVFNNDAWVRMRAVDAIEKVCRQHPEWLTPYVDRFQNELASNNQPSIQWHLAQMYSQLNLNEQQKLIAIHWLKDQLSTVEVDWIVSANAMKTLVQFTNDGTIPIDDTVALLGVQQNHKSNSVVKKANKFLAGIAT